MIQFIENKFTGLTPRLNYEKDGYQMEYPLYRIDKNLLSTRPIPFNDLTSLTTFEITYDEPLHYSFRKDISSVVVNPNKNFSLSINAGEMSISGAPNTFHDTTIVWLEKIDIPQENEKKQ